MADHEEEEGGGGCEKAGAAAENSLLPLPLDEMSVESRRERGGGRGARIIGRWACRGGGGRMYSKYTLVHACCLPTVNACCLPLPAYSLRVLRCLPPFAFVRSKHFKKTQSRWFSVHLVFFLTRSEPRSSCHDGRSAGRKNSVLSSFNRSKQSGDVNRNQACLRTVASSVYRKFI
jgi:hypothetical protein